jgi:hypothetical protein
VEPTVAYECTTPSHQVGDGGPDKLTVHDGKWAFCPFDAKAEGHVWGPNRGLPLSMLQHAAATRVREKVRTGAR